MAFVVKPYCQKCRTEWARANIGNGTHSIFVCHNCKNIVNSARIGFTTEYAPCAECAAPLTYRDIVESGSSNSVNCPRCLTGEVLFEDIMHFSTRRPDRYPQVGQLVHGRINGNVLHVPGLSLIRGKTSVTGIPEGNSDLWLQLRTKIVALKEDVVESIEFEFSGYVQYY